MEADNLTVPLGSVSRDRLFQALLAAGGGGGGAACTQVALNPSPSEIFNAEVLFREDCSPDEFIDVIMGNRVYMPCLYVSGPSPRGSHMGGEPSPQGLLQFRRTSGLTPECQRSLSGGLGPQAPSASPHP